MSEFDVFLFLSEKQCYALYFAVVCQNWNVPKPLICLCAYCSGIEKQIIFLTKMHHIWCTLANNSNSQ